MPMRMVDIGKKGVTLREAVAGARLFLKPSVIRAIKKKSVAKGDVLEAARLAGILAVKRTPELIPLCHPLAVEYAGVEFAVGSQDINIKATVRGRAKTGFEMEALCAVSIASLTIYDMCKPLDKDMVISGIRLLKKIGGKSGEYERK